jgi:hypothetical protein
MNHISFRLLFVCIFLPPILYIFSIQLLEQYLQNMREKTFQNIIIQDYEAIYNGKHRIEEEINTNIARYFEKDTLRKFGVITRIMVTTKQGKLLYPYSYEERDLFFNKEGAFDNERNELFNYVKTAERNFQILNDDLTLSVDVRLKHNSWLANSILIVYLFVSILILYWHYKRRYNEFEAIRENEQRRIDLLSQQLRESEISLDELSKKEEDYIRKIQNLKNDKEGLESDIALLEGEIEIQKKKSSEIDEFLDEMERLEEEASTHRALKEEKEREIAQLREEIDQLRRLEKHGAKRRKKDTDSAFKRFSVLYKNVLFLRKAIEGYLFLTQDFQLKAEEIIQRLDADDPSVDVKRKLFTKKGKLPIFEVIFSYSGRIYFKKRDDTKIEILAIGTKNTQDHDIKIIEGIS